MILIVMYFTYPIEKKGLILRWVFLNFFSNYNRSSGDTVVIDSERFRSRVISRFVEGDSVNRTAIRIVIINIERGRKEKSKYFIYEKKKYKY